MCVCVCVTEMQVIGYTAVSGHTALSALIKLGSPCCLVLRSSWGGNTPLMAGEANKCHENQILID